LDLLNLRVVRTGFEVINAFVAAEGTYQAASVKEADNDSVCEHVRAHAR
jgi:hypothetical protein